MLLRSLIGAAVALAVAKLLVAVCYDSYAVWQYQPTAQSVAGAKVLVTGSSKGIGKAVALLYCSLGANVVVHGRSRGQLDKVAAECKKLGGQAAHVVTADMSDTTAAAAAVKQAAEKLGGLDIAVINHVSPYVFETQYSLIDRVQRGVVQKGLVTDLLSYAAASYSALPHLEASNGSIIFVTSLAAQLPLPYCYAYCYAKRALAGHAIALRQELAINGSAVHVGLAHLGSIDTDTARALLRNLYTETISFATPEATAQGIAAMSVGRINDLVIPAQLKYVSLLNGFLPELLVDRLRGITVRK